MARVVFLLAVAAPIVACGSSPDVVTRPVTLHVPEACKLGANPSATYVANGDFQPSERQPGTDVRLDAVGQALAEIPAGTRAITVTVNNEWRGLGEVPAAGDVDILILPNNAPCALSQPATPLRARTDAAVGVLDPRHVLVAGGLALDRSAAESFLVDLTTGLIRYTKNDLAIARSGATATPFGENAALVAGGANIVTGESLQTAEVLTGDTFDPAPIVLFEGRALHGATTLATGETLLVGGVGQKASLASLEIVDPVRRKYRIGLPALEYARQRPTVLRLASGEILVAGGLDDAGNTVPWLEWFSGDATRHIRKRELVSNPIQDFVALPGGGALAVVSQPGLTNANNVWVISREGDISNAPSIPPPLTEVRLFPGNKGAPILWTGDRWLEWDPWTSEFAHIPTRRAGAACNADSDCDGGKCEGTGQKKVCKDVGPETDVLFAPDAGLALWLLRTVTDPKDPMKDVASVAGLRFDARGDYTTDTVNGALLVDGTEFFAPDRLITAPDKDHPDLTPIRWEVERGLVLAPEATAFLTDATFASFSIDLDVTSSAPLIVLRQATGPNYGSELEVGGVTCPLVIPDGTKAIHVTRSGSDVNVALDQGDFRSCPGVDPLEFPPDARVSIGLRGIGDTASAKNLMITRR